MRYFHGSTMRLTELKAGSFVTPFAEDAAIFAVPWSSNELMDTGPASGRPPKQLIFKKPDAAPEDQPIYVHEALSPELEKTLTNTGASYDWNRTVKAVTRLLLVRTIRSWRAELATI